MDYKALWDEISTDPLGRGYAEMTNPEIAADLMTEYRSDSRDSLSGDEIFQQTNAAEFGALTEHKQGLWVSFCSRNTVANESANVTFIRWVFGDGSQTMSNLTDAINTTISRAAELGLGTVSGTDVGEARRLFGG